VRPPSPRLSLHVAHLLPTATLPSASAQDAPPALDRTPAPKVNSANITELKNALDDHVKDLLSRPADTTTSTSPASRAPFTRSYRHDDVRLALGWSSVAVAAATGYYGYRTPFHDSTFWVSVGVALCVLSLSLSRSLSLVFRESAQLTREPRAQVHRAQHGARALRRARREEHHLRGQAPHSRLARTSRPTTLSSSARRTHKLAREHSCAHWYRAARADDHLPSRADLDRAPERLVARGRLAAHLHRLVLGPVPALSPRADALALSPLHLVNLVVLVLLLPHQAALALARRLPALRPHALVRALE